MFPFIFTLKMKNQKIAPISRILLVLSGLLLIGALLFPIWRIELSAPQYPEGLVLQLHANKLAGNVDIINGLNHYIGMKTLHTEDFIEFTIMPYILGLLATLAIAFAVVGRKKPVYILFGSIILFAVLAAVDFYRWNYEYGHNLDPNAAIIVPGMAYQPPLIGYKQLLNFGAYSIPDIGGWMLISAGLLLFIVVLIERNIFKKRNKVTSAAALLPLAFFFFSCQKDGSVPISLNKDACDNCKMTITDGKFAAELISKKGRVYKFDDVICMRNYVAENDNTKMKSFYVNDFLKSNELIPASSAYYLKGGNIHSPMNGNTAAFSSEEAAKEYQKQLDATPLSWEDLIKK